MAVITVERLQESKSLLSVDGFQCDCETVDPEEDLVITASSLRWLKKNHYQVKLVETFGETGMALAIYPAE